MVASSANRPLYATFTQPFTDKIWFPDSLNRATKERTFQVSMWIKKVIVDRPGVDISLFDSPAWRWPNQDPLSDGASFQQGKTAKGQFPAIVRGIILVKDVKISPSGDYKWRRDVVKSWSDGKPFAFANILLAGSASYSDHPEVFYPAVNALSFFSPDIQVLAYTFQVLPQSPHPDNSLPW